MSIGNSRGAGARVALAAWLALTVPAFAEDISGVKAASLDQPRIYVHIQRAATGEPLVAKAAGEASGAVEAFLDTGATGIVISHATATALGLQHQKADKSDVIYEDVGVGGTDSFQVSEPLFVSFAKYSSLTDGDNPGAYCKPIGPVRLQLRQTEDLLESLTGGMDVAGMPAIFGKVIVMDVRPVNTMMDKIKTSLEDPKSANIPVCDVEVPLTPVSFTRFTRLTPAQSAGPAQVPNPMIGPNPFDKNDKSKGVQLAFNGKSTSTTMLLDTGAACSMISIAVAKELGVTDDGHKLVGPPAKEQFTMTVGGIGGQKTARGFYLDTLILPTRKGDPIRYLKAPVLVADISVTDPKTKEVYTLGGVFGMNFLVASAEITGGLLPDIGALSEGAYSHVIVDQPRNVLGLKLLHR